MKTSVKLFCLLILHACQKSPSKIQPTISDISESVYASGMVKSKNQYEVFASVNGIVKEILVKEGDSVDTGTPIIKIFNKPSALNARNSQLAAEYAKVSANKDKLDELRMAINLANAKMENDSLIWKRQQTLWSQNIGTRIEFEQKELNYKNSQNNYKAALVRYNDTQRQLELNAKQTKNIYEINNTLAEEYTIKSEVEGKVYNILKTKGEMVNTLNPIALIGDGKTFLLELQVDERDIAKIKPNQRIFITMDSYRGQTFEAVVMAIDPVMNGRTKTFTVEAEFIESPKLLYPYMTVEANILIQKRKGVLIIPRSYLLDESFVITKDNKRKKIVTGLKDYQNVEVLEGLNAEEIILKPDM
jgi:HlyD family secretion protein